MNFMTEAIAFMYRQLFGLNVFYTVTVIHIRCKDNIRNALDLDFWMDLPLTDRPRIKRSDTFPKPVSAVPTYPLTSNVHYDTVTAEWIIRFNGCSPFLPILVSSRIPSSCDLFPTAASHVSTRLTHT